jgi:phosphoserine phosphatase RsbU/P
MTEALIPQPSLSDIERRTLHSSLVDRRERLTALPAAAVGPRIAGLLAEVDAALDRLEGPDFGACARCDGHVEPDRLRANPLTTVCLDCLSEEERRALERDLELASRVQASLLPPWDFTAGDWSGHFLYQPHGAVSGDYVDVVALNTAWRWDISRAAATPLPETSPTITIRSSRGPPGASTST